MLLNSKRKPKSSSQVISEEISSFRTMTFFSNFHDITGYDSDKMTGKLWFENPEHKNVVLSFSSLAPKIKEKKKKNMKKEKLMTIKFPLQK